MKKKPIRILIADDHPIIVDGLITALSPFGIEVACHTGSSREVLGLYRRCTPDVIVLDIRFGRGEPGGLDITRQALKLYPEVRIVIYSQFDQTELVQEAYRSGCAAFVTKNSPLDLLVEAIRAASSGKTYFTPEIATRLATINVKGDDSPGAKLDDREMTLFLHLARGATTAEIAEEMGLSTKTVSLLTHGVKEKLGVSRGAELTLLAVRYRLIEA